MSVYLPSTIHKAKLDETNKRIDHKTFWRRVVQVPLRVELLAIITRRCRISSLENPSLGLPAAHKRRCRQQHVVDTLIVLVLWIGYQTVNILKTM